MWAPLKPFVGERPSRNDINKNKNNPEMDSLVRVAIDYVGCEETWWVREMICSHILNPAFLENVELGNSIGTQGFLLSSNLQCFSLGCIVWDESNTLWLRFPLHLSRLPSQTDTASKLSVLPVSGQREPSLLTTIPVGGNLPNCF